MLSRLLAIVAFAMVDGSRSWPWKTNVARQRFTVLLSVMAVLSATAVGVQAGQTGVTEPLRAHEIGASLVLAGVKYPEPLESTIVVPGATTTLLAPGIEVMYARLLTRLRPGSAERGKLVTDFRLECPFSWSPHVERPEGWSAPAYSALSLTPRVTMRMPADRRAQFLVAVGGGVSRYTERRGDEVVRTTAGVYLVGVGGQVYIQNRLILRLQYGGTSIKEPGWHGLGALVWQDVRVGVVVPF